MVFPSVEESIAAWVKLDGCTGEAQVEEQGAVTHTAYASCKADTAVELYAIEGLDHSLAAAGCVAGIGKDLGFLRRPSEAVES